MSLVANLKNLVRHSSVYLLSTFVQRALGLIMLPLYTDTAYISDKSAYGDYSLLYMFIAFMTIIYLYGMDLALMRYFFIKEHRREDVYKTAFAGVLSIAGILSIGSILFADNVALVLLGDVNDQSFIYLAAGILFFDSLTTLPYNLLRAEEKSTLYSIFRIGRFLTELFLNIVFVVWLDKGVEGILLANLTSSALNFLILLPYQFKYLRGRFNWNLFKILARFGLPMLPNGLAFLIVGTGDKYLMRLLLNKDMLGSYAANYRFGAIMLMIVMAFRTAWQPFFLRISDQPDAKKIYAKVLTYFTLAGSFLVVGGSYFVTYFVRLPLSSTRTIMGSDYWDGNIVIPFILSAYLLYGIYVNLTVGIYITKRTRLMILFTGLAAITNLICNYYMMPLLGIMGAAVSAVAGYAMMAVSIYIANQRIYPIQYESGRIAFILVYLSVMLSVLYWFEPEFLTRIILIVLSPLIFIITGFFKKAEIEFLRNKVGLQTKTIDNQSDDGVSS